MYDRSDSPQGPSLNRKSLLESSRDFSFMDVAFGPDSSFN